ncbi:MAG: DciA family protein [Rubinisphaera brasiliensis]|uniref:DUF721 domain-containing protein n=1 Tax=Rubinisphaera brasiliensis (strain ATCC 49424 / DSM 5305 / JCM 21570 / IAM 15109 / NBRC 103401 / IFAM 1448) TaxID=756272 RepID=F0SMU7_RUBBR|nr:MULTISPECIES: DciA family protein [Rubinisphaera]ADY59951.1 protein of unknown function DUF721 [Rubinisphaera brasiliensis DSM 5305]MBR9802826.1 DUF721 domain-containing protein [bacterium]
MKKRKRRLTEEEQKENNLLQHVTSRRQQELQVRGGGPTALAGSLREVIARRKIGRRMESLELSELWKSAVTPDIVAKTRVVSLRNHVLLVEVSDSVLMSELASFHQRQILRQLQQARPDFQLRNVKWRLNPRLASGR